MLCVILDESARFSGILAVWVCFCMHSCIIWSILLIISHAVKLTMCDPKSCQLVLFIPCQHSVDCNTDSPSMPCIFLNFLPSQYASFDRCITLVLLWQHVQIREFFLSFSNWNFIQFLNDWQMAKKSVHIYNRACTSSNSGVQPISIYMSSNCLLISSNCSLNSLFFSTRSSFFFSSSASLIVNCSTFFSSCSALTSASRKLRESQNL